MISGRAADGGALIVAHADAVQCQVIDDGRGDLAAAVAQVAVAWGRKPAAASRCESASGTDNHSFRATLAA